MTSDSVRGFMYVLGAFAVYIYAAAYCRGRRLGGDALMQENSAITAREDR